MDGRSLPGDWHLHNSSGDFEWCCSSLLLQPDDEESLLKTSRLFAGTLPEPVGVGIQIRKVARNLSLFDSPVVATFLAGLAPGPKR